MHLCHFKLRKCSFWVNQCDLLFYMQGLTWSLFQFSMLASYKLKYSWGWCLWMLMLFSHKLRYWTFFFHLMRLMIRGPPQHQCLESIQMTSHKYNSVFIWYWATLWMLTCLWLLSLSFSRGQSVHRSLHLRGPQWRCPRVRQRDRHLLRENRRSHRCR